MSTKATKAYLEKYKKSKEYRDFLKEFNSRIYSDKKYRDEFKEEMHELQDWCLDVLERFPFGNDYESRRKIILCEEVLIWQRTFYIR